MKSEIRWVSKDKATVAMMKSFRNFFSRPIPTPSLPYPNPTIYLRYII